MQIWEVGESEVEEIIVSSSWGFQDLKIRRSWSQSFFVMSAGCGRCEGSLRVNLEGGGSPRRIYLNVTL